MGDMRRMALLCALAAAGMGGGVVVRRADEGLQPEDLLSPTPEPITVAVPRRPATEPKVHTHSREIERRLRQQAKREAKSSTPDSYGEGSDV